MTIAHTICRPIDSIRGIFAVLIILHHYLPVINIPYHYDFGNTIVLFFFVLSGFHITLTYKDKIVGNSRRFLVKRCAKIFPLQWLTLLLFVAFGVNLKSLWAIPFHLTLTQSINPFWYINFSLNTRFMVFVLSFLLLSSHSVDVEYGQQEHERIYYSTNICYSAFYHFVICGIQIYRVTLACLYQPVFPYTGFFHRNDIRFPVGEVQPTHRSLSTQSCNEHSLGDISNHPH